jgi:hypothetical protein
MTAKTKSKFSFLAAALRRRDSAGGVAARDEMHNDYGRRVEQDGSWTIYHVFTGVPAHFGAREMTGMSASESMTMTVQTNAANGLRRREVALIRTSAARAWNRILQVWIRAAFVGAGFRHRA